MSLDRSKADACDSENAIGDGKQHSTVHKRGTHWIGQDVGDFVTASADEVGGPGAGADGDVRFGRRNGRELGGGV